MPVKMPSSEAVHDHELSPPSTRPSSAASTCTSGGPPNRTSSMDSLFTSSSTNSATEKPTNHEFIPTRITRATPKINTQAMQFVKVGPAELYKSAEEQLKKAEQVKALRKHIITEEEDWQQPNKSSNNFNQPEDWQSNLDKWKSSRRKRNEEVLERVIEVKKNEQDDEMNRRRRKSKTFSEMVEDKKGRGRRYNLMIHDDDGNDFSDLGLSTGGKDQGSTDSIKTEDKEVFNDIKTTTVFNDIKDTKSDAGFCTGSDTGSDGVFAEDNISDTSSALGDKKEAHDSLLDSGSTTKEDDPNENGDLSGSSNQTTLITSLSSTTSSSQYGEYTYDKAIEGYKQFAESTTKKRTTSMSNLRSTVSSNDLYKNDRSSSPSKGQKIGEKLNFFTKEMDKEFTKPTPEVTRVSPLREKSPKIDVGKRRSMFELHKSTSLDKTSSQYSSTKSLYQPRKLSDTSSNLRNKVASFENLDTDVNRYKGVTPPRDSKFKEKLANFSQKETSPERQPLRKKSLERDQTFHQKLASFSEIEKGKNSKSYDNKSAPVGDSSLRNKIASFEQLDQLNDRDFMKPQDSFYNKDRAISMECLKSKSEVNPEAFNLSLKLAEEPNEELRETPETRTYSNLSNYSSYPDNDTLNEQDGIYAASPHNNTNEVNYYDEIIPPPEVPNPPSPHSNGVEENIYENIIDEPVYENIYEKVNEDQNYSTTDTSSHYYQTIEDARLEKEQYSANQIANTALESASTNQVSNTIQESTYPANQRKDIINPPIEEEPTPIQPPPTIAQVVDISWTDTPLRAAPPSMPPPPPPPDDESDTSNDEAVSEAVSVNNWEVNKAPQSSIKKELQKRRSEFLGTSPVVEEAPTIKPPPDLSSLLREECEADRKMKEKFNILGNHSQSSSFLDEKEVLRREQEIIENLEREEEQRKRYQWQESQEESSSDMQDLLQYNETLAQLEMEMVQHDKNMLHRTGQNIVESPPVTEQPPPRPPPVRDIPAPEEFPVSQPQTQQTLPIQEFYRAPTYSEAERAADFSTNVTPLSQSSPISQIQSQPYSQYSQQHQVVSKTQSSRSSSQYTSLASPHPFVHSHSASSLSSSSYSSNSPRESTNPEPVLRKKRAPPPVPEKSMDTAERLDAIRQSKQPGQTEQAHYIEPEPPIDPLNSQNMSKQTLKALSAIPKPRLTDNDSWITKKKQDGKRDYSKHWLIQEAEQRRIEQYQRQDRTKINQPNASPTNSTSPYQHQPSQSTYSVNAPEISPASSYSSGLSYNTASTSTMSYSNSNLPNNNNNRRDQATTYQPRPPQPNQADKPLPDSIINTLTQRVNNKNKMNSLPNGKHVTFNNNYQDENYHDYMNTDAITGYHQNPSPPNTSPSQSQVDDQKLLSVSGKKKCSHCGDELGRGAAMIIESLRLFYHIPCFKCCVCGIQLGNGTAGADVRVRNHKLHCHNCYSNDEGMKFSKV